MIEENNSFQEGFFWIDRLILILRKIFNLQCIHYFDNRMIEKVMRMFGKKINVKANFDVDVSELME